MLSDSPQRQAIKELGSDICAACSGSKKPRQSFCYSCYKSLPATMQQSLWARFGSGYEENYHEAKDWLMQERRGNR
jgi:hypothetical protein